MYREDVIEYVLEQYDTEPEFPWKRTPDSAVFRHSDNRKWFGLLMTVKRRNLGLFGSENEWVDVLNVKCDPVLAGSLRGNGILPAYHMNHTEWISILLDGSVDREQIFRLLDLSFELTSSSCGSRRKLSGNGKNGFREWLIPANPKYYDVEAAFRENSVIDWKQSSSVKVGDMIYLYVGAPVSAILYECRALEVDIPYHYESKNLSIRKLMKIEKLKEYDRTRFSFEVLKSYGVYAVRGPRSVPNSLLEELKKY